MNFKSPMHVVVLAAVVIAASPIPFGSRRHLYQYRRQPLFHRSCVGPRGCHGGPDPLYNGYASSFTPAADSVATQVDVVVAHNDGTPMVDVGIYNDAGGLPGTLISSLDPVAIPATPTDPESVTLTTSVALTGGQTYWVAVLPGAPDTRISGIKIQTSARSSASHSMPAQPGATAVSPIQPLPANSMSSEQFPNPHPSLCSPSAPPQSSADAVAPTDWQPLKARLRKTKPTIPPTESTPAASGSAGTAPQHPHLASSQTSLKHSYPKCQMMEQNFQRAHKEAFFYPSIKTNVSLTATPGIEPLLNG